MPSNFKEKNRVQKGRNFSVPAAVEHIKELDAKGKAAAATYIWRAPDLVQTPLRSHLQSEPWFKRLA
jgi:hypothetical protein